MNYLVYLKRSVKSFIHEHQHFGSHSNVYLFEKKSKTGTVFKWSHPGNQPFGILLIVQCRCGTIKGWKIIETKDKITHFCISCNAPQHYLKPEGVEWVKIQGKCNGEPGSLIYTDSLMILVCNTHSIRKVRLELSVHELLFSALPSMGFLQVSAFLEHTNYLIVQTKKDLLG